ncbi:unnamed protein product [Pylaiella littoralis]
MVKPSTHGGEGGIEAGNVGGGGVQLFRITPSPERPMELPSSSAACGGGLVDTLISVSSLATPAVYPSAGQQQQQQQQQRQQQNHHRVVSLVDTSCSSSTTALSAGGGGGGGLTPSFGGCSAAPAAGHHPHSLAGAAANMRRGSHNGGVLLGGVAVAAAAAIGGDLMSVGGGLDSGGGGSGDARGFRVGLGSGGIVPAFGGMSGGGSGYGDDAAGASALLRGEGLEVGAGVCSSEFESELQRHKLRLQRHRQRQQQQDQQQQLQQHLHHHHHHHFSSSKPPGTAAKTTPAPLRQQQQPRQQQLQQQQSSAGGGGLRGGFSSTGQSSSSSPSPSMPRVEGGPFSGSGLGVGGVGSRFTCATAGAGTAAAAAAAAAALPACYQGDTASCGAGGNGNGYDGEMIMGETLINGSYFGEGVVSTSTNEGSSSSSSSVGGSSGSGGGQAPHLRQHHHQRTHAAHGGRRLGEDHLRTPAHIHETAAAAVRGHRPRNSSASCGSFSALANDGSLVLIGGVGAAGGGGGFLDHSPPPVLSTGFDPSVGRLPRHVSVPGMLQDSEDAQNQAFASTPLSSGPEGSGGYFSAVTTPAGDRGVAESFVGGGKTGRCSGEEAEGDDVFNTQQQRRGSTPLPGKGGIGFSFPPTRGVGGGAGSGGSIYVTPRSTPRHTDGGGVSANEGDGEREAYAHQEFSRELDGFEVGRDRRQGGPPSRGSFGVAGPPPAAAGGAGPAHGTNSAAWPLDTGRETWSY